MKTKTKTPLPDATPFIGGYSFRLLSYFVKQHHESLLALGCGNGWKLEYWKAKGLSVVGVDIDPEMGGICRAKGFPFVLADLDDLSAYLPYADNSFDIVTLLHTLEHIKNPGRAVFEALRVAKDLVLINSPLGHSYFADDHIQFWYSFEEIILALFSIGYVFFIEMTIAKPADVQVGKIEDVFDLMYNNIGFTAVIYKQLKHLTVDPSQFDQTTFDSFTFNLSKHQAALGRIWWCKEKEKPVVTIWGNNERISIIEGEEVASGIRAVGYQRDLSWFKEKEIENEQNTEDGV